jgi:threonine dehydrogenase-like Zn-dependent dehydrogenase
MRGIWLEDQKITQREDLPLPEVTQGEAMIKMRLAGICSTDLELVKGYYPFKGIPGHEFVGEVVDAPDNPGMVGKRVVGEISIYCGTCEACLNGRPSHCEKRRTLGIQDYPGVFADYLKLPVRNLHLVPDSVTDEQAVFTELLAAALEIQEQVHVSPGMRVLVVGAGRLGILIAQCLAATGCDLKVVVRREAPARLLSSFGIVSIYPESILAHKADVVVEVTGSPEGFALSRKAVRARGTLVLKSTFAGDVSLNLSSVVVDEITLVGSRCGPFKPALKMLTDRRVNPLPLISARYALEDGVKAFTHAGEPGVMKVLLYP